MPALGQKSDGRKMNFIAHDVPHLVIPAPKRSD